MTALQHTYDMHGHEPGCPACAAQREEVALRDRASAKARNTLSADRASTVTITIAIKTGAAPATKVTETFKVPAGTELDPASIWHRASRLGYGAIREHKGH